MSYEVIHLIVNVCLTDLSNYSFSEDAGDLIADIFGDSDEEEEFEVYSIAYSKTIKIR